MTFETNATRRPDRPNPRTSWIAIPDRDNPHRVHTVTNGVCCMMTRARALADGFQIDDSVVTTSADIQDGRPPMAKASSWNVAPGSAGVAMFDPLDTKKAILPDGNRVHFLDAAKRGFAVRAATEIERHQMALSMRLEELESKAVDVFGDTTLAKAFMQGLPTASANPEVMHTADPVKTLSLFDRVAMKAKELRAEDRSAKDHEMGRALAYACQISRSERIDIRQALQMCGVDASSL